MIANALAPPLPARCWHAQFKGARAPLQGPKAPPFRQGRVGCMLTAGRAKSGLNIWPARTRASTTRMSSARPIGELDAPLSAPQMRNVQRGCALSALKIYLQPRRTTAAPASLNHPREAGDNRRPLGFSLALLPIQHRRCTLHGSMTAGRGCTYHCTVSEHACRDANSVGDMFWQCNRNITGTSDADPQLEGYYTLRAGTSRLKAPFLRSHT